MNQKIQCKKTICSIIMWLLLIQGLLLGMKQIVFCFVNETLYTRSMTTMVSMMILFAIIFLYCQRSKRIVSTHIHWDHIGGHKYFPDFYAHSEELSWLNGEFPLTIETIREMVADRCDLPDGYDTGTYEFFQGTPTKVLEDGENIELGGRNIQVLHTPGHAPGHMCFWESDRGYLFTGDLVYKDTLFAYYPSTDPDAYLASLEKISELPVKKVFPAHHSLDIQPEILSRMRNAFRQLREDGKLHHGSGTFDYGDWAVWL